MKLINIIKEVPEIVVAVVNMGGIAVKRSSGAVVKAAAVGPVPVVETKALPYLIVAKAPALGALPVVAKLPGAVFHLFGEAGVAGVAGAGVGTSIAHRLAKGVVVAGRFGD